jgi:hypothetical protein
VLAYLARYTHRVAISNDRLLGMNVSHVSFRCKDSGDHKTNVITLKADSDDDDDPDAPNDERPPCPYCGGRMQIIESFRGPQARPFQVRRLDTS